jgi:hypothetical protein
LEQINPDHPDQKFKALENSSFIPTKKSFLCGVQGQLVVKQQVQWIKNPAEQSGKV